MKPRRVERGALYALLGALLGAAISAACVDRQSARFPHLVHLTGVACGKPGGVACLNCTSCHSLSAHGSILSRNDANTCRGCHHEGAPRVLVKLEESSAIPQSVGFQHERHLAMPAINGQCVKCHGGVLEKGGSPLPPMSQCFTCHEHQQQWDRGQCTPCHSAAYLSRTLPKSFLRHDQEFARHHGQFAVEDRRLCQSCHTQKQCNDCHDVSQDLSLERRRPEQVERTLVHGGDFIVRHAIEAQAASSRCARCHTPESCDSCHLQRGVSGLGAAARNPHPPGWVGPNANASSAHGRDARRDILLCASCHDEGPATNCIRCHRVGGYGGNPHPNGWRSARGPEQGMCRYCHE